MDCGCGSARMCSSVDDHVLNRNVMICKNLYSILTCMHFKHLVITSFFLCFRLMAYSPFNTSSGEKLLKLFHRISEATSYYIVPPTCITIGVLLIMSKLRVIKKAIWSEWTRAALWRMMRIVTTFLTSAAYPEFNVVFYSISLR